MQPSEEGGVTTGEKSTKKGRGWEVVLWPDAPG